LTGTKEYILIKPVRNQKFSEGKVARPLVSGLARRCLPGRIIYLLFFLFIIFSCASTRPLEKPEDKLSGLTPAIELPREDFLTIIAAGDNLFHNAMIRDGEEGDYEAIYEEISPLIKKADIAFINQETLLGGESFGFTGYPIFNTPQKVGKAIIAAGFNIINHATNHIMDRGEKAVLATLDFWETIPQARVLGAYRSEEQRNLPFLVKKNNITLGFLSYTYGTNGLPVPKDKPYLVSLINTEIMEKEIAALRPLCDFLVVSMHWGEEYDHNYNKRQKDLAGFLAEQKVDLVIGHHPHVIQSIEYIERPDGKTMLCYYSLGNFISAQTENHSLLGALAYIRLKKTYPRGKPGGETVILNAGAIPVVSHYEENFTNFKIYPLYDYTKELIEKHRRSRINKNFTLDYMKNLSLEIFKDKEIFKNPFSTGPDLYQ